MPERPDAACVQAAQSGEPGALDALITCVWDDAYRIARGIVGHHTLAQDTAQEACAQLMRSLPSLRDPAQFRGWFYRLAVNAARAILRRERRYLTQANLAQPIECVAGESNDATLERLRIDLALQALPSRQREAIVLHCYADLTSKEIARVVGAPDGTIRYRLFLAKRRLRALLSETREATTTMTEVNGLA